VLYYVLNIVFPDRRTLIPQVIHGDIEVVEGVVEGHESRDGDSSRAEKGLDTKEIVELKA
jgi:hypothetical protein